MMTITKQKLTTLQKIEPILIDLVAVATLVMPFQIEISESWHPLIFIVILFYAMRKAKPPKNGFLKLFHGLGMTGLMLGVGAIGMLIANHILGLLVGTFVAYPLFMLNFNPLVKLYEHPIRIVIVPLAFAFFAVATQDVLTQRLAPELATLSAIAFFLPVRFFLNMDRPQKWYHTLLLLASVSFYMYNLVQEINYSPSAAMWKTTQAPSSPEDRIYRLSQTDSTAIFSKRRPNNAEDYLYIKKTQADEWIIDTKKSLNIPEGRSYIHNYQYKISETDSTAIFSKRKPNNAEDSIYFKKTTAGKWIVDTTATKD